MPGGALTVPLVRAMELDILHGARFSVVIAETILSLLNYSIDFAGESGALLTMWWARTGHVYFMRDSTAL